MYELGLFLQVFPIKKQPGCGVYLTHLIYLIYRCAALCIWEKNWANAIEDICASWKQCNWENNRLIMESERLSSITYIGKDDLGYDNPTVILAQYTSI
jgi:hypothetical protein